MGQNYTHLSLEQRIEIYRWHAAGRSAHWIGEALGRHHSAISRELRRNSKATKQWPGGYEPLRADELARDVFQCIYNGQEAADQWPGIHRAVFDGLRFLGNRSRTAGWAGRKSATRYSADHDQ